MNNRYHEYKAVVSREMINGSDSTAPLLGINTKRASGFCVNGSWQAVLTLNARRHDDTRFNMRISLIQNVTHVVYYYYTIIIHQTIQSLLV
jgi:hypothetical protein